MKIKLKREGGFIGIPMDKDVEFDDLNNDEQKTIETLIEKSKPKSKAAKAVERAVCPPDAFNYTLSLRKGTKTYSFKFNDSDLPDDLMTFFTKYLT